MGLGVGFSIKRCQNSNYKYVQNIKGLYTNNDSTNKKYHGRNGKHKKEPNGNSSVESTTEMKKLLDGLNVRCLDGVRNKQ